MILPYVATVVLLLATAYSAIVSFGQRPDGSAPTWVFPNPARRSSRIAVGICTVALFAVAAVWIKVDARSSTPHSARFLLPEGYVGWVRVEFQVSGAPTVPVEEGEYVLQIPPSGVLKTSSAEQYGWAKNRYYYTSKGGVRMLPDTGQDGGIRIWGKINGEESGSLGKRTYQEFFVGTAQEFNEQVQGNLTIGSSVSEKSK